MNWENPIAMPISAEERHRVLNTAQLAYGKPTMGEDVQQKHIDVQKQTVALPEDISNFMAIFFYQEKHDD